MGGRYVFDCETDGLLPELTKLHCLGLKNLDTGDVSSLGSSNIHLGLAELAEADLIVGHNVLGFDIPAIQKVYPSWKPRGLVRDTLVLTRLMWPHIKDRDFIRAEAGTFPKKLIGRHSLEAWGHRIGNYKGDYTGGWEQWSQEMQDYMDQDVRVTFELWQRCVKEAGIWEVPIDDPNPPPKKDCVELEHRVAAIVEMVQRHGFRFDEKRATDLHAKVSARKHELFTALTAAFGPRIHRTTIVPKANNKKLGYVKGVPFEKVKEVPFNPGSRQQVGDRLKELGWEPTEFGADGYPTVNDDILTTLPYPQAKMLAEYYTLDKRVGQIATGKEAWLKRVKAGRIHGRIHSNGAHTGRATHSNPNMAQVPGNHAPYGKECRELFTADAGHVLVGCDADALELRDLAGYMARYDGGAYIETVLRGDKAKGTDMHSLNAKLWSATRDNAKVGFYLLIYGGGDPALGVALGASPGRKAAAVGRQARAAIMRGLPAFGKLVDAVGKAVGRKYLVGLDGRRLVARAQNAALNTLLQSAGAVQMKRAIVILFDELTRAGLTFGDAYALVAWVHDELQITCKPELAEMIGQTAVQAIRDAGTYYSFRCPLDGQFKKGGTWKETH